MTPEELDALALEVADAVLVESTEKSICEFARRYLAALAEKMEPAAYVGTVDDHPLELFFDIYENRDCDVLKPLYLLEDWKKCP